MLTGRLSVSREVGWWSGRGVASGMNRMPMYPWRIFRPL